MMQAQATVVKVSGDVTAVGTVVAVWTDYLPHAASLLTIIWMAIRIWETPTVQGAVRKIKLFNRRKGESEDAPKRRRDDAK